MSRILEGERTKTRRPNPDILGFDFMELAELGFGAAGAGFVNDKIVHPLARGFVGGGGTVGQLMDAVTTGISAYLVGKAVGMVGSRSLGNRLLKGGGIYAVAKGIGAFVPNYSLSVTYPSISLPAGLGAQKALPAGATVGATTTERSPIGQSGL